MKIQKEISEKVDKMILKREKLKNNFEEVKKNCQHYNKDDCLLCIDINCKDCSYYTKR